MRRWSDGKFREARPLQNIPLFERAYARPVKSAAVARGNRTRRLYAMRAARLAMRAAADFPASQMVDF